MLLAASMSPRHETAEELIVLSPSTFRSPNLFISKDGSALFSPMELGSREGSDTWGNSMGFGIDLGIADWLKKYGFGLGQGCLLGNLYWH